MASIKSISLPDGTSYDFKDEVSGYIKDTGVYGIYYGTCATAAATAAKVATLTNSDGFSLTKGVTVAIKFTHHNTIANPTLNVDGSGAKSIKRYGTTAPSTSATSSWNDNSVLILVYDGRYWQLANWLNTTYSAMSASEISAGTSGTARLISPVNLKTAIHTWATGEANVQSDWEQTDSTADDYIKNKPTIPTKTSELANDSTFITEQQLSLYPTTIDLYENCQSTIYTLAVNGTTATLYRGSSVADILFFSMDYASVAGILVAQVLNGASSLQTAKARVYEVTEVDAPNAKVRLVAVDDGVIYTADLQDTGNGLTGTFSSQTIPTGGITTETDPTVPAWAKESTKPSYTASEVGAQPTLVSGTNIKTINGNSLLGSGNLVISGGGSEPTMQTSTVSSGGNGTWHYRIWPSGWQEAWYQGSIQFTAAATSAGGWYRSTKNFALPISFADNASILVSGATSGRVYTHGGIKTNGTQFEAQILGGATLAANTYSGWNVYVAGYGRG